MKLRSTLLALAALATVGIGVALCRWGCGENRDLLAIARGVQRGEELDAHFELRWRHNAAKRVLAAEVVAGRMSLREAAGHFRRLDEADPFYPPGSPRPAGDDRFYCGHVLDFGWVVLAHEERYAAAARWYAGVFTAHAHLVTGPPTLVTGPPTGHRYYVTWAAVLAGCGQGRDASALDAESRAGFRRQALGWLRADLEASRRLLDREPAENRALIAGGLQRWLRDPYLAGVRGPDALSRLPAAERQAWQKLWAEVADTLVRAEGLSAPKPEAGSEIPLPERLVPGEPRTGLAAPGRPAYVPAGVGVSPHRGPREGLSASVCGPLNSAAVWTAAATQGAFPRTRLATHASPSIPVPCTSLRASTAAGYE